MTKPGHIFNAVNNRCEMREIFNGRDCHLEFLSAADLRIHNTVSPFYAFPGEEVLLFNLGAPVECRVGRTDYVMEHYDVLYVTTGAGFSISHQGNEEGHLYVYRASGEKEYPVFHSRFKDAKSNDERIRHLNRKVVYKMFDVSEEANRFMAGYTFYEDHTRAWPPHNHTDQEEVYSFIEGEGAMTVYEDNENQTFVTSVATGDHVTIPVLNYHPVFSHDSPLCFIWCIAGERYWVGDKNTDFMKGNDGDITT
ncbi:MAG: 5-deoxy-glucuronate isomerase [Spirochaetaceae bacterium]|nr:5-deoxy-glucuronate isomerase [Spirochaetaceae bacterium]